MGEERYCGNYVRAFCSQVVKAKNDAEREILHLITSASVDRYGDIVEPGGAQLENFLKNPIVMVDHDYRTERVIGKAVALTVEGDGIVARTRFRDTPLAREAYALAAEGLGGWSIGFRPIEYDSRQEKGKTLGFRFKKWELLEYSMVPIPANQDAVMNAIQRGFVTQEHAASFFSVSPSEPEARCGANAETLADPALVRKIHAAANLAALHEAAREIDAAAERLQ